MQFFTQSFKYFVLTFFSLLFLEHTLKYNDVPYRFATLLNFLFFYLSRSFEFIGIFLADVIAFPWHFHKVLKKLILFFSNLPFVVKILTFLSNYFGSFGATIDELSFLITKLVISPLYLLKGYFDEMEYYWSLPIAIGVLGILIFIGILLREYWSSGKIPEVGKKKLKMKKVNNIPMNNTGLNNENILEEKSM
jgi:hypothetical protein